MMGRARRGIRILLKTKMDPDVGFDIRLYGLTLMAKQVYVSSS
jgi:hypothetical protein